ncbi:18817_t:CDS:2 [Rhizophagus irregularis]|nr:18817_t:CDS:2 [Rhizophagus irregularis]
MEKNDERARQLLKWIQDAISSGQLKIRIPGIKCFHALKKYDLLPRYLRNIGSVFAVLLRHCPRNHTSPAQNYTIVNYRPRGVPYDQAKPFKLQTPTKTNHMAAHPGKSAETWNVNGGQNDTEISAITKEIGALKKNASHLFNHCVDPQKYRVKINDKLSTNSSDSYDSSVSSEEQVPPHKR